ncbi:non-ribosomal peptide synthetase [Pseudobacteriovorax antillogorgiicola]|uniref:Amino acid adenylation domain-containing protein n=1 Tax=Pseudobacteriovorax antillogorgiicola TaxID=1513793 RepID=A0A1Y6BNQ3_9BACT|nr:non-ribosomal peptide synthetase [Pseudobacteriovorax antillogorgiicola]TCS55384.1 amino acid adenylation domain-containing protein [Pseudobacteriovorax antillogorgiicola]SMF13201.1 amino acid adenylation domain-containing protein [Pseudobacteriovorax antillogorgiicola]
MDFEDWKPVEFEIEGLHPLDSFRPSTDVEQEVWISEALSQSGAAVFNEMLAIETSQVLDRAIIASTLDYLSQKHHCLRTVFSPDGQWACILQSMPLKLANISCDNRSDVLAHLEQDASQAFDVVNGPLVSWTLATCGVTSIICLKAHHIICDGLSMSRIMADFVSIYECLLSGQDLNLQVLSTTSSEEDSKNFWLTKVQGVRETLRLPYSKSPQYKVSESAKQVDYLIPQDQSNIILDQARKLKCSPTALFVATTQWVLGLIAKQDVFALGVPAVRSGTGGDPEPTGHHTSMVPIPVLLSKNTSFLSLVQEAQSHLLDAAEQGGTTLGAILREHNIEREEGRLPLVNFVINVDPRIPVTIQGEPCNFITIPKAFQAFECFLNIVIEDAGITLECNFQQDLFDSTTIEGLIKEVSKSALDLSQNAEQTWPEQQLNEGRDTLGYWKKRLTPLPEPIDIVPDWPRHRSAEQSYESLDKDIGSQLKSLLGRWHCRSHLPEKFAWISAYARLLSAYSRQDEFLLGVENDDRTWVPLRIKTYRNQTFEELSTSIFKEYESNYEYKISSTTELTDHLATNQVADQNSLWSAAFRTSADSDGILQCDLELTLVKDRILLRYRSDMYGRSTATALLEALETLMIESLKDEHHTLTFSLGKIEKNLLKESPDSLLLDKFKSMVQSQPDHTAMVWQDSILTYRELDLKITGRAYELSRLGISCGSLIGIHLERSDEMVITLFAVLSLGAGYVPLDPLYPRDRLEYMTHQGKLAWVISDNTELWDIPFEGQLINISSLSKGKPEASVISLPKPDQTAYVIYTSGSTGKPKGVEIQHRALAQFIEGMQDRVPIGINDRVLGITTISFDISILEIFMTLAQGATLVLGPGSLATDPEALQALLIKHDISILQATPATWTMLLNHGWQGKSNLRAISGGEALRDDLAKLLVSCTQELWNVYGPTEATVWATASKITKGIDVDIGTALDGYQIAILDDNLNPCPRGMAGTLWISGPALAKGYLYRPDLTAERFQVVPSIGSRAYNTGDLCRINNDGKIQYLRRVDTQVKIRGFRIELGEIESLLAQESGVKEAAVIVREDQPGDQRLTAYITLKAENSKSGSQYFIDYLNQHLPRYMIPNSIEILEHFPLTDSGKIDRKSLPRPKPLIPHADQSPSDLSPMEAHIASLWQKLIGFPAPLQKTDSFFTLGGHSLLAIQFMSHVKEHFNYEIKLRDLLTANLGQIAHAIETIAGQKPRRSR